MNKFKETLT